MEKGVPVSGSTEGAGGDGGHLLRAEGFDLFLEGRKDTQGATNGGGLEFSGDGDAFSQPDGVGFFMKDAEDALLLLGQKELEGVGAEVEHGPADRGKGHRSFKAPCRPVGKTFGRPRRKGSE